MDVRACRECRKLFNYIAGPEICPSCREKIEQTLKTAQKYLFEHKGADISEISQNCQIEEDTLQKWVNDGKLQLGSDSSIKCKKCGRPISIGEYCEFCKNELLKELTTVLPEKKKLDMPIVRQENKMRYFGSRR